MLVAAVALLIIAAVAVLLFLRSRGDGFPDEVLGYERLRGGAAETAEDFFESIKIGELRIRAAVYTDGTRPRLVAVIYENYPSAVSASQLMQGASNGMEASGGAIEQASLQTAEADGYEYACVEAGGPGFLVPGGTSEDGVLCVFSGETVGLLITTHATVSTIGLQDAQVFVDAYRSA